MGWYWSGREQFIVAGLCKYLLVQGPRSGISESLYISMTLPYLVMPSTFRWFVRGFFVAGGFSDIMLRCSISIIDIFLILLFVIPP